jgi:hypothetical protein
VLKNYYGRFIFDHQGRRIIEEFKIIIIEELLLTIYCRGITHRQKLPYGNCRRKFTVGKLCRKFSGRIGKNHKEICTAEDYSLSGTTYGNCLRNLQLEKFIKKLLSKNRKKLQKICTAEE